MKKIEIAIGSFYKPVTDFGGYAYHIVTNDFEYFKSDCFYKTSSQRMEMKAFIEAIKIVYEKYGTEVSVIIYTKLDGQINALRYKKCKESNVDLYDSIFNFPTKIVKDVIHKKIDSNFYMKVNELLILEEGRVPNQQDRPDSPKVIDLLLGL